MRPLRIALTKGRLEKSTAELMGRAGLDCSALRDKGRWGKWRRCWPRPGT